MLLSSFTMYSYLGAHKSKVGMAAQKPTAASPRNKAFSLPGTLYLAQSGALYSLSAGRFHQLTPQDGWTQPALYPDGSALLAVKRTNLYSDVYVLSLYGAIIAQETNNTAPLRDPDTGSRHWSFYPRLTPDRNTLFMSYDSPKYGYDVPFSIWAMPVGGTIRQAKLWTNSIDYTGGDMQPIPVSNSAIIYTKYSYGPDGNLTSQLWLTSRAYTAGRALTSPQDDCSQPSLSPDGHQIAMICTYERQIARLEIGSWDGSKISGRKDVIDDRLVAQPTWAPDGSGIAYLAPGTGGAPFQLWFVPKDAYNPPPPTPTPIPSPTPGGPYSGTLPSPSAAAPTAAPAVKAIQITTANGFDATSPMAWG
jgi:Tol biopolymer transport system component